MIHQLIAVFDVKTGTYDKPICVPTFAAAERAFYDAVNNPELPYGRHAGDYSLFIMGTYDDQSGELVSQKPSQLCQAAAVLQPNSQG